MRFRVAVYLIFLAVLLAAGLAGCQRQGLPTPEEAAVDYLLNHSQEMGLTIHTDTLKAIRQEPVNDHQIVLLAFDARHPATGLERCVHVYGVDRKLMQGWTSNGGGGMCKSEEQTLPGEQVTVSGGFTSGQGQNDPGYSMVNGMVLDDQISAIDVTWNDGVSQQANIQDGTFFAARSGQAQLKSLVGVDSAGQVVYTHTP